MGENTLTGECRPKALARDHAQLHALVVPLGQVGGGEMLEMPARLPRRLCGKPTQVWMPCRRWPRGAQFIAGAFGMGDAAPRRHPIDVAGLDLLHRAQRVAVHLRAFEQIGDGGKPDMGMRPHIHALAGGEIHRPEIIEEHEGPDAAPRRLGQDAGDDEAVAQIVASCR